MFKEVKDIVFTPCSLSGYLNCYKTGGHFTSEIKIERAIFNYFLQFVVHFQHPEIKAIFYLTLYSVSTLRFHNENSTSQ